MACTYWARDCPNAWLVKAVEELIVFEFQVDGDGVEACNADEDQVYVYVVEVEFDDRNERVRYCR